MDDIVIDACCLINLCAVGELGEWLPSPGCRWHLPAAVRDEALYIHVAEDEGARKKQPVDLKDYLNRGILHECAPETSEEKEHFVELAIDLDDGESMALAIAYHREWMLATDDRKARTAASKLEVPVLTTPQIMKKWEATGNPTVRELGAALHRIQTHACYRPPADSELIDWWDNCLKQARVDC